MATPLEQYAAYPFDKDAAYQVRIGAPDMMKCLLHRLKQGLANILLGASKPADQVTQTEIENACRDANILDFIESLPQYVHPDRLRRPH